MTIASTSNTRTGARSTQDTHAPHQDSQRPQASGSARGASASGALADRSEAALAAHVRGLALAVIEVSEGVRPVAHLARWVDAKVYTQLELLSSDAQAEWRIQPQARTRPTIAIGRPHVQQHGPAVVECVAVAHMRGRSRALTLTLSRHPRNGRWILTELTFL